MADEQVTVLAVLQDRITGPIGRILRRFRVFFGVLGSGVRRVGGLFRGFLRTLTSFRTLVAGALVGGTLRVFARFEAGLAQVATLSDKSVAQMGEVGDEVRRIAVDTGASFDDLLDALFQIESAGLQGAAGVRVLDQASKLAAAGNATVAESTKGLIAALNAYGLEAEDAADVSDALFQAMKQGQLTVGELAAQIGKVAPIARVAGLTFDEVAAAIAAITKGGLSADQAATALRAIFTGLIKPTQGAADEAERLGINLSAVAVRGGRLPDFLVDLVEKTDGLNEEIVARLFPNIRGLTGILTAAADNAQNLRNSFESMREKAGATETAFAKVASTLQNRAFRAFRSFQSLLISIGAALKDFLVPLLDNLRDGFERLAGREAQIRAIFESIIGSFTRFFGLLSSVAREGDIFNAIIASLSAGLVALGNVFLDTLPVLLKTVKLIGRNLGHALISAFVGSTKEQLARTLTDPSAFSVGFLIRRVLPPEATKELEDLGRKLREAEQRVETFRQATEERDPGKRFLALAALRAEAEDLVERDFPALGRSTEAFQEKVFAVMASLPAEARKALEEVRRSLEGEVTRSDVTERDEAELRRSLRVAAERVQEHTEEALSRVRASLSENSQKALDDLEEFVSGISQRIAAAGLPSFLDALDEARTFPSVFDNFKPEQAGPTIAALNQTQQGLRKVGDEAQDGGDKTLTFMERLKKSVQETSAFISDGVGLITDALLQFSSFAADALVNVFDRSRKSFSKLLGDFLRGIGRMIVQALIFRAIAGAFFSGGGGGGDTALSPNTGFSIGRQTGGPVFGPPGPDKVRARLTAGEHVQPVESVRFYGLHIMEALRRRLIPRAALESALNRPGTSVATFDISRTGSASGAAPSGTRILPVLVTGEHNFERMLRDGTHPMERFMNERGRQSRGLDRDEKV